jgi:hypothetical protein
MKPVGLVGQRFGKLLVLRRNGSNKHGKTVWECQCDCGETAPAVLGQYLRCGHTKSCGCLCSRSPSKRANLIGQRFGRLTAIHCNGTGELKHTTWQCQCDCGKVVPAVPTGNLTSGNTKSCGCLHSDVQRVLAAKKFTKHGGCRRNEPEWPEHRSWREMRRRCTDPKHISFVYYGGRGITVCERWMVSFEAFLADMGRQPNIGRYSLGRIDVNGNYEPGNCKWETPLEQHRNKRPFSEWKHWEEGDPRRKMHRYKPRSRKS